MDIYFVASIGIDLQWSPHSIAPSVREKDLLRACMTGGTLSHETFDIIDMQENYFCAAKRMEVLQDMPPYPISCKKVIPIRSYLRLSAFICGEKRFLRFL